MNRDQLEGKGDIVKGKFKQAAGNLTDDPALHDEGVADEAQGKAKDAYGKVKEKVGETVEDVGRAIKR